MKRLINWLRRLIRLFLQPVKQPLVVSAEQARRKKRNSDLIRWRQLHPDKNRRMQREWQRKRYHQVPDVREKKRAAVRAYYWRNRDRILEKRRQSRDPSTKEVIYSDEARLV